VLELVCFIHSLCHACASLQHILPSQELLESEEGQGKMLKYIPDEELVKVGGKRSRGGRVGGQLSLTVADLGLGGFAGPRCMARHQLHPVCL
jgi:hypothetical protein